MKAANKLSGLAPISFSPMRRAIRASSRPRNSQINWVALNVKMRCSWSNSRRDVVTSDIRFCNICTYLNLSILRKVCEQPANLPEDSCKLSAGGSPAEEIDGRQQQNGSHQRHQQSRQAKVVLVN